MPVTNKTIKMIKYYLKNSKQEVKIGDNVTVTVPANTPYGETKGTIRFTVTPESLKQLIKDKLVIPKEGNITDFETYKPFVKKFADNHNIGYGSVCNMLHTLAQTSMNTHNMLMLEMIAEYFNGMNNGCKPEPGECVYVISHDGTVQLCLASGPFVVPYFLTLEKAHQACVLMKPFYEAAQNKKQENKKCQKS